MSKDEYIALITQLLIMLDEEALHYVLTYIQKYYNIAK